MLAAALPSRADSAASDSAAGDTAVVMSEVVVTGSTTPRPLRLGPVQTRVIGADALVQAGYGSLSQALRQETPGLNVQKVGFGSDISFQGLDARHVLFLMDGERISGDMAGNPDFQRFNLHSLDRIEIVKGASSTLYGSRASGAVINLISKRPARGMSILAGGRWGMRNQHNFPDSRPSDFNYMFERNADRPNLQGWLSAGFGTGVFSSQTDVWYGSTDAFYMYQGRNDVKTYTKEANPFLPHDVTVVSEGARPPLGIEGSEHVQISQKFYCDPTPTLALQAYGSAFFLNTYDLVQDLAFTQSRDYTAGVKATYSLGSYFTVRAGLHGDFYDRFKRHEREDYRTRVYRSSIVQPRLTLSSTYFAGHSIILGVEHVADDLTSDRFNGDTSHRMQTRTLRETEYFLQDDWTPSESWMVSAGVRTNYSRAFGLMWMPKVAVKWSPAAGLAVRANCSLGYRTPSIKELFFNWDHLGMFMIRGNENLRAERNNYFSLGAEYSNNTFFASVNAYANLFRHKIEGVWRIYDLQYNFEYTNLRRQTIAGVEALLRWRATRHVTLNGSYSYVRVSKRHGVQVNSTSPHAATASVDWRLRRGRWEFNSVLSASYMGRKRFDVQDRLTWEGVSREAYFTCRLPQYVMCNLAVSNTYDGMVKVTLGVDNLFNYVPKTLGSGITMFNIPATAGIRGFVQLEVMIDSIIKTFKKKTDE